jgi:hypothetical protein
MDMVSAGLLFLIVAAWMARGFAEECRRAGGWPWAGEVPLMLIALMTGCGLLFLVHATASVL